MVVVLLLLLLFVVYKTTPFLKPLLSKIPLPRLVWPDPEPAPKQKKNDKNGKNGKNDDSEKINDDEDDQSLESIEFKSSGILDSQGSFSEGTMNSEAVSSMPDDEMSLFNE